MRIFFDTSVLVAAFQEADPRNAASMRTLAQAERDHAHCSAHTLAEFYSVLTRMPPKLAIPCQQALFFLETMLQRVTPVELTAQEYIEAIERTASDNIGGGKIYDALLLAAAHKVRADVLYTWNEKDFVLLNQHSSLRIAIPHAD